MTTIGIVSASSFEEAHSLPFLIDLARKEFDSEVVILNPNLKIDEDLLGKIEVLYPRILPVKDHSLLQGRVDYYLNLVKKYHIPHTIDPELYRKEFDKYEQVKMVSEKGFLAPKSFLIEDSGKADLIAQKLGYPVVMKDIYGYGGIGVHLAHSKDDLEKLINNGQPYLLQEYICLEKAVDYRVYVVGGKVVGGIKRENETVGEFRSNTALGAKATFFTPSKELDDLATKIAEAIGNNIASIDFINKDGKYYFIELNNSFDVHPENEPRKIVVARAIMEYCISLSKGRLFNQINTGTE